MAICQEMEDPFTDDNLSSNHLQSPFPPVGHSIRGDIITAPHNQKVEVGSFIGTRCARIGKHANGDTGDLRASQIKYFELWKHGEQFPRNLIIHSRYMDQTQFGDLRNLLIVRELILQDRPQILHMNVKALFNSQNP